MLKGGWMEFKLGLECHEWFVINNSDPMVGLGDQDASSQSHQRLHLLIVLGTKSEKQLALVVTENNVSI